MVLLALIVLPVPVPIGLPMLRLWSAVRFGWAARALRERISAQQTQAGDLRSALALRREGVEIATRRGGYDLAFACTLYGGQLLVGGWPAEGIEYLSVADKMTAGWTRGRLRTALVGALAGAHAMRGNLPEAASLLSAMDRPERQSVPVFQASIFATRALSELAAGRPQAAVDSYKAALEAAYQAAQLEQVLVINNNLAGALIETGDLAGAEARLAAAESMKPPARLQAHLLGTRAELALARGDLAEARAALVRSAEVKDRIGAAGGMGWTLATRARIEAAAGNLDAAREALREAAGRLEGADALDAWRRAAAATGTSAEGVTLCPPAPDPLLEDAQEAARPLREPPAWAHFGPLLLIAVGLAFAIWTVILAGASLVPGGVNSLFWALLLLAGGFWLVRFRRRVPRR